MMNLQSKKRELEVFCFKMKRGVLCLVWCVGVCGCGERGERGEMRDLGSANLMNERSHFKIIVKMTVTTPKSIHNSQER
jgi:hypothetical protein